MKQFIQDAEPEMRRDLSTLIQTLKHMVILEGDQQKMVSLILKWQQKDRLSPNMDRAQTPLFDHFLSLSKMTSYSTRSARNAWIEETASIFDGLFYVLTGGNKQAFQRMVAGSKSENTSGPAIVRAENEWVGMGRQLGLGAYGIVQGMGLSLAGTFDSAAQTSAGAAQSVLNMTGSHYQLAAPLALTPFISQSYDQLTPQVRQALGANASNDVHVLGMTGNQFGKIGGQAVGQLMTSGFGKAAQATKYVQALNKGAAVLHATQAVDASLQHLTDLIVARHEKDPNAPPATYLLDDDILSEMCVTLDAVADLGVSLLGGNKTKKTAALRQMLRKLHLAARFGKDIVTAASTADALIARAQVLYQSHPDMSAMDIVTDPTILEALVAFVGSASDAAQVGSGASRQAQKLGKWSHRIKTSADFIAPVFQARQALAEMSDQALALHRRDPHPRNASLLMDTGMQSHMLDVLSSAGMMASAGGSHSRPVLRLLAAHTENIVRQGRKGVAFEAKHGTGMMAQSVLGRFKSTASVVKHSVVTHLLGGKAQSAVQWMLPHFGGDGTKPLIASTLPGDHLAPIKTVADGGTTGPFYPAHWTGLHYKNAEQALNDSANVAVYVNGVQTPLGRHTLAAQELAQQIGKPVVGIYNAAGSVLQDLGQSVTDKVGILGMGKRNAAINTLARVIGQHGSPAVKNGGLDLYAHSQGGIIVSEAIRQAKGTGHDVSGLDVTTFGGAAWSRPEGLRGYHNYAYDSDVVPTLGGSTSAIGALLRTPFNRSNPLNPFMGGQGMVSTVDDTFTLHHRGALGRPHGVIADPLPGPVSDKDGGPVLDSEDYYLKALPRFRAKEAATRARLSSLGPVARPLAGEALNSAMMTRSLAATSFALAKGAGSWLAGKTEKAYSAASGLAQRAYSGAAGLAQAGYGKTEQLVQGGYEGVGHAATGAYSKGAGAVASGYSRLDGGMRRLPSLPFLKPNTVWGALDSTFRGGGGRLDKGLRGGGAALDIGLRGAGRGLDRGWRGSAAAFDSAARLGGGMADHSLRRISSGVTRAGRSGANAVDDYFDATNALQRKGTGDHPDVNPAALRSDLRKQSSGFLPDGNIRARLGGTLGFDPGGARLHTGPAAASASRRLNAEAFTIGSDVFFGANRFDPHSPKGLGLIAHELTHVGQQTGTTGSRARFFTEAGGDEMEREAQHTAEHVLANAGSRGGLFVEDYVREYEGDGGLTQADRQRLDRISVTALKEAERMLEAQGVRRGVNADALDVQVEIDLGGMSDGEAARVWAEAIVAVMPPRQTAAPGKKAASSATAIMRSPGDGTVEVNLSDQEGNLLDVSPEGKHYLSEDPHSGNAHDWSHSTSRYKPSLLLPDPNAMFNTLMAQVVAVKEEQRVYADRFQTAKDMKYWFARVYQHVTEHEIEAINNNLYQYPHMKMQEVLGFSATYKANIDAWLSGNQKSVESNWKAAFAQAETGNAGGGFFSSAGTRVKNALLPSMQAHIRFDLPRAIAAVYNQNYLGIPGTSLEDFHQDFNAMGPVFDAAQADLTPEIVSGDQGNAWFLGRLGNWHFLPGMGAGKGFGPGTNIMGSPFDQIFDVQKERAEAWDKAGMISNAMQKGESRAALQKEITDKFRDGALQVGGAFSSNQWRSTKVEDYDWLHQPGISSPPVQRSARSGTPADQGPSERAAVTLEKAVVAGMPPAALPQPMEAFTSPLRLQRKPASAKEHLQSAYFAGDPTLERIYHGASALRRPSHGKAVGEIQQALSDLNFRLPEAGVDQDFGKETETAVQKYQTARSLNPDGKVGPDMLRALEADLNAAPNAAPEIAATEPALGQNVASDMSAANSQKMNTHGKPAADSGVWYQYNYKDAYPKKWTLDLLNGYASPVYFDRIAGMDWRLKPRRSASAALKAWLKGLTIAECNSSVIAMEWDTLRAALGDKKFDEHFGSTTVDIPEDQRLRIVPNGDKTPLLQYMKLTEAAQKNTAGTDNNRPAKIGDWYYFYNHPQYLLKHPGGAWQGENSIFMGVNAEGKQIWAGLGASNVTEKGMYEEMVDAYNMGRDENDFRALRGMFPGTDPQKHPEQLPNEYREGSGTFPSVIGVADVLDAPPYTTKDGVTRKGGFVVAAGHALDAAKVQKMRAEP